MSPWFVTSSTIIYTVVSQLRIRFTESRVIVPPPPPRIGSCTLFSYLIDTLLDTIGIGGRYQNYNQPIYFK